MENKNISYSAFLEIVLVEHLIFMIPVLGMLLLFNLAKPLVIWPLVILYILPIPINALFTWLIAKGSNWVNLPVSVKASGAIPGGYQEYYWEDL
jgi:hypothetical protein